MLFSFVSIIAITMIACIGYFKYSSVYDEIVQSQLIQTSYEVNSAIEAKYEQVSTIAAQVSTDADIQQLMTTISTTENVTNQQQQLFKRTLDRYYPYVNSISDYRFYQLDGSAIYPNVGQLQTILDESWMNTAIDAKGQLIWIGQDATSSDYSYAIKVIRLINQAYRPSGFLVLRLHNKHFDTYFENEDNFIQVYDRTNQWIIGKSSPRLLHQENGKLLLDGKQYYVVKNESPRTNWSIYVVQSLDDSINKIQNIWNFTLVLSVIAIIICFLLSWVLASYITSPLHRLTSAMRHDPKKKLQHIEETYGSVEMHTLHRTYNEFITQIETLIEEVYEKQLLQQQAELKALQAQIHPHFLYNTLNAFYWKLIDEDKDELANYVLSMSALFKYSVGSVKAESDIVTIRQELEHIEHYLNLMQMRLGERLSWELQCEPALTTIQIPKLLLQPIIENAILHGIEPQQTNGKVTVHIYAISPEAFTIVVTDNGKGIPTSMLLRLNGITSASDSEQIGIQNIRKRLEMYYSEQVADTFLYDSDGQTGTTVTITLPKESISHDRSVITR
ncbi:MAG: sensor histidine kinase [Solibacillus sp.]